MSGSTDISGAKSAEPIINDTTDESIYVGQLVGYRNNALVFAADDNWSLVRYDGDVSVDDIGAWGEVLRYSSVLTVDETAHTVKVNSPSSSYTSIGSKSDFVISALDFQFDETALLSFTTTHTDISNSDISITSNISLSGTGITGLTRDNDIGSTGAKCTYSGTITGNKITLAIGEPYGSGITSHNKEGRGKIYRHSYNGLVGIANNVEYSGVQFDGSDTSAFLSTVMLFLHHQIELAQTVSPRTVFLLIVTKRFKEPHQSHSTVFVNVVFHQRSSFIYKINVLLKKKIETITQRIVKRYSNLLSKLIS